MPWERAVGGLIFFIWITNVRREFFVAESEIFGGIVGVWSKIIYHRSYNLILKRPIPRTTLLPSPLRLVGSPGPQALISSSSSTFFSKS